LATVSLYSEEDLLDRLTDGLSSSGREVVFLIGAPASAAGPKGIPDVEGIINLLRQEFRAKISTLTEFNERLRLNPQYRYQEAFKFFLGKRNQDAANAVIKRAVLAAHVRGSELAGKLASLSDADFRDLEEQHTDWVLPSATAALGEILSHYPRFGSRLLTSNFDPLLEMSIAAAGGNYFSSVLDGDGSLHSVIGRGCNVVHFHGYWYGGDTLHTPAQLHQPRPQLRNSLLDLLANTTVVVIAYSGWDDIFLKALMDVIDDYTAAPDVVWTFFENDPRRIHKSAKRLMRHLAPGIRRNRVTFYRGIDCHTFLPKLLVTLKRAETSSAHSTARAEVRNSRIKSAQVGGNTSDSPPRVDAWVGREAELALLRNTSAPVVLITGIGGQGKSALAAQYVAGLNAGAPFEAWDWRDCREEGDRFVTQLIAIIERLSARSTVATDLEGQDVDGVTDVFFQLLDARPWLFVFDNVDHYIDLERLQPTSALAVLLSKALKRSHNARFVFTCRPNIHAADPGVLPIHLKEGLSQADCRRLFALRGVKLANNEAEIDEAQALTAGHPLLLNLIAGQVSGGRTTLFHVLSAIKRGKQDAPSRPGDSISETLKFHQKVILDPIWETLKEKQKTILRTMAELVKPETEDLLGEFLGPRMHWAQFAKHTRTLIGLNLIVVKPRAHDTDLLDLHPLVREYIRNRFERAAQDPYVRSIIIVLDQFISRLTGTLKQTCSFDVLEYWTQKIELSINRADYSVAIRTLSEVTSQLVSHGWPEEFVRVSRKLFEAIDWSREFQEVSEVDSILHQFITVLIQFGERVEAERYLDRYETVIPGKTGQFINLCNLRCYLYWYAEAYESAIEWGERGEALKIQSKADVKFSCAHNLALARRDSGLYQEALSYFLGSQPIEKVLDPASIDSAMYPSFYGNIGRCLQFQGKLAEALICYRKSALRFDQIPPEPHRRLNQGYARLWIGETFLAQRQFKEAGVFLRAAALIWENISPPRSRIAEAGFAGLLADCPDIHQTISRLSGEQLENECKRWIAGKEMQIRILTAASASTKQ
jgi:tetratricopeptide (TPR) repeat protein